MLSSRTQKWWAIGAGLSLVLLAATWFLMVSPRRSTAAELDLQTENLQAQTSQQQLRTAQLKAALAQLPKKKADLAAIRAQLPPVADIPKTITDLEGFADSAGVTLDQVTPGTPVVAGGAAATAAKTAGATASQPVLVQIPLSIQTTGDYFESSLFLKSLQSTMTRAVLVQGIQVAGAAAPATTTTTPTTTPTTAPTVPASAAQVSMTVTGQLFVMLDGSTTLADVKKDAAKATA